MVIRICKNIFQEFITAVLRNPQNLDSIYKVEYNLFNELVLSLALLKNYKNPKHHKSWIRSIGWSRQQQKEFSRYCDLLNDFADLDQCFNMKNYTIQEDGFTQDFLQFIKNQKNWQNHLDKKEQIKLVAFLKTFYQEYLRFYVKKRINIIKASLQSSKEKAINQGSMALLMELSDKNRCKLDQKMISRGISSVLDLKEFKLIRFSPSLFSYPDMYMIKTHNQPIVDIIYDLNPEESAILAPRDNILSLKAFALSDNSRLKILKLLSEEPLNQKEIGAKMGFAKSTISRHVSILLSADIIKRELIDGRQVLVLDKRPLRDFSDDLLSWLKNS